MNRLPRKVKVGLEVTLSINQVTPSILAGIIGPNKAGAWDEATMTIWIDKTLSLKRKWAAFRHELGHALWDIHEKENGGI